MFFLDFPFYRTYQACSITSELPVFRALTGGKT